MIDKAEIIKPQAKCVASLSQPKLYDILSSNITIFFASHRKSVHKPKIRPIVNPSIAPKNGLLIRKGFRNLQTDILPVSQFLD